MPEMIETIFFSPGKEPIIYKAWCIKGYIAKAFTKLGWCTGCIHYERFQR